jgi:DNA-binding GntR family transcriptional regulator
MEERVYQRVFDAILEQRLSPGTKLNEEELAQIFSVSRTVIRKALSRLTHEGVVETRKNKGTTVASTTPEEANSVFEARRITEAAIVRLACRKITDEDVGVLRGLISAELESKSAGDYGKSLRLSGEFHFKIAEIAGNKPLAKFAHNLISRISLIVAQFESPGAALCHLPTEHEMLVSAMKSGDEDKAETLMLEHIRHIEDKIDFSDRNENASLKDIFVSG